MRCALSDARNPAEASVESVLPGVHDRLAALQSSVNGTKTTVMDRLTNLCSDLMNHVQELNNHSRLELASQFAAVAANLVKQTYTVTDGTIHQVRKELLAAQVGDNEGGTEDDQNEEFKRAVGHRMTRGNPSSITRLYYEFYGMEYYSGVPIQGGVAAAEAKFRTRWRQDYKAAEITHLNRVTRIAKAVNMVVEEGRPIKTVLEDFDNVFKEEQLSISRMVVALKTRGVISSRRSPKATS
jgi:hypothetical protein